MGVLKRKPFIGIAAFVVILFVMPIGHMVMALTESLFGEGYQYHAAGALGLIGVYMLILGIRTKSEVAATWWGFFAGQFMWTGWVEFSFVYIAQRLAIAHLMENGEVVTKAEYLLMPASAGLLFATLLFFFLNENTRCNFFKWFHRIFKMKMHPQTKGFKRNFALITAMETIYITWFFYLALLFIYDKQFFGDQHPMTYVFFFIYFVWSLYLIIRLLKYPKMAAAVRYAIPTVVIFWNSVEILGRWSFFTEIWNTPEDFVVQMVLISLGFVAVIILVILLPEHQDPATVEVAPA